MDLIFCVCCFHFFFPALSSLRQKSWAKMAGEDK
jgi:hypothetical protein